MIETLQRLWQAKLQDVFRSARRELVVSSPYVSDVGATFLLNNVSPEFRADGILRFVTNLSPANIWQGSTNPKSLMLLFDALKSPQIFHLPRLHAKVYVSDRHKGIVTSGNLTAGGIFNNYEYGVFINSRETISAIRDDLVSYGNLGAKLDSSEVQAYSEISDEMVRLHKERERSAKRSIELVFRRVIRQAKDELIRARLAEGPLHTVFAKTIHYLLKKYGPLATVQLHALIEQIHQDLCDNTIDRVIDGKHFGKKWKHAVRTAQQQLKKRGLAENRNGIWRLI